MPAITLDNLLRHLEKHGPEGILETARDAGLPFQELVTIQERIDGLPRRRRHRKSAEERIRTWLGLDKPKEAA